MKGPTGKMRPIGARSSVFKPARCRYRGADGQPGLSASRGIRDALCQRPGIPGGTQDHPGFAMLPSRHPDGRPGVWPRSFARLRSSDFIWQPPTSARVQTGTRPLSESFWPARGLNRFTRNWARRRSRRCCWPCFMTATARRPRPGILGGQGSQHAGFETARTFREPFGPNSYGITSPRYRIGQRFREVLLRQNAQDYSIGRSPPTRRRTLGSINARRFSKRLKTCAPPKPSCESFYELPGIAALLRNPAASRRDDGVLRQQQGWRQFHLELELYRASTALVRFFEHSRA